MVKKRTVKKSKKKTNNNSAYFIYKSGNSRKFWRIVKNGSKITTHYGRFGTLGQMNTKDYGSKADSEYDKLIQSKKKKGYIEKHDFGDKNPKPPSSIKREYMKICNKAEKDIKLNPLRRNYDCEGILDQDDNEIKYMTGWYKDALKNKEFDFDKLNEHDKTRRKRKKTQKGSGKKWQPKPGYELSSEMLKCLRKPWKGSVPKKNTKNKKYDCPMFVDRTKPFVLSGTNKAPKIQLDHYDACYEAMYKDCEKKTQKGGRKLKIKKKRIHKMDNSKAKGKNKPLEKLWTDMSNMKKYVFIMKDGSYQIKPLMPSYKGQRGSDFHRKYCLPMIEKANNDDSVKAILTAGNSYDGYEQLYDDVGNEGSPSVDSVLKDYKKYWKYQIDKKLYTC